MPFIGNAGQFANIYEKNYTTTTLRVVEGDAAYQAYNPADSHYKLITNLQEISNIGASTNRTVTFSNVNTGFTTSSNVGIANTQPIHTMDIGSKVHIDENDSNTFWTSGSLYADELKGETAVITNSVSVRDVLVDRVYPKTNGYIYSTSNVGIITSNPSYTLDVDGDINFTGTLYENGVAFSGGGGGDNLTAVTVNSNLIGDNVTAVTVNSNLIADNVTAVTVNSNLIADNVTAVTVNSNLIGDNLTAVTVNSNLIGDNVTAVTVNSNLIGDNVTAVTVNSNLIGDNVTAVTVNSNLVAGNVTISNDLIVNTDDLVVDTTNSRIGINKSNPSHTLDVDGDINFTGTLYENGVAFSGGGGGGIDTTQTLTLTNAITGLTVSSNAVVAGNVTASVFLGDGGLLSNIESQRVYTLAVNGSSDYIFQGPGFDNPTNDPVLRLIRGFTYIFDNSSNYVSHPFKIRTGINGTDFTSGVVDNNAGITTFTVPMDAPPELYYQCSVHTSMGNKVHILKEYSSTDDIPEGSSNLYYTDAKVDSHLNTSSATSGQVLSWTGSDYAWAANGSSGSTSVIAPVAFAVVNTTSDGSGTGISWGSWNSSNYTLDFTFDTAQSDTDYSVITDSETFDNYFVGISNKSTTGFRAEFYDDSQSREPSAFSPFTFIIYASTPTIDVTGGSSGSSPWTSGTNSLYYRSNVEVGTGNLFVDTTTSNVGVGTTTPAYTLDVNGDINFTGSIYQNGIEYGGGGGGSSYWLKDPDTLYYNTSNVGIGTTDASSELHVVGNVQATYFSGDGSALTNIQSSNVSDFSSNVTRIDNLTTDLSALTTDLSSNATRIDNLTTDLSSNATRIDNLTTDLSSNATRIDNLTTDLSSNASRIDNLTTDLSSNATRIDNLTTDLSSNASRIDNLTTDLSSNASRIDNLTTDLSSNASRIENLESSDLTIGGVKTFSSNLQVGTANLFVDTTTSKIGIGTDTPLATLDVNATDAIIVPNGTTAERPSSAVAGMLRYNSTTGYFETYTSSGWSSIATPPIITSFSPNPIAYANFATEDITVAGSFFDPQSIVQLEGVDGTTLYNTTNFTFVDNTTLRFRVGTLASGQLTNRPYKVVVTNGAGITAKSTQTLGFGSPTITSFSPNLIAYANVATEDITVEGSFFDSQTNVQLEGADGTTLYNTTNFTFVDTGTLRFRVGTLASGQGANRPYKVVVTNALGTTAKSTQTLGFGSPTITSFSPNPIAYANVATEDITVTGSFFDSQSIVQLEGADGTTLYNTTNFTFVDNTTLRFRVGTLASGQLTNRPYKVVVTNALGTTAKSTQTLGFGNPTWSSPASGSTEEFDTNNSTTLTLSATDATGGSSVSYSLVSGSLPGGLTLSGNTISGTSTAASGTTNTVTIRATDTVDTSAYTDLTFTILSVYSLYSFSSHTFTNAGVAGRTGPTLTQLRSAYTPTWTGDTNYLNVVTQGIQEWTVPRTGTYRIEAWGAEGGRGEQSVSKPIRTGKGARMRGDFTLTGGDVIRILVGQRGGDFVTSTYGGGGGGGTFVTTNTNTALIVAGGGNGESWGSWNAQAPDGLADNNNVTGGTDGGDGDRGSGGGGLTGDGSVGSFGSTDSVGKSFTNGGVGGLGINDGGDGSFGGGGGARYEGGGGGGYSGGQVVPPNEFDTTFPTYGAGSYNGGTNQSNTAGNRSGDGQVTITLL